jgi:hypothetical protein
MDTTAQSFIRACNDQQRLFAFCRLCLGFLEDLIRGLTIGSRVCHSPLCPSHLRGSDNLHCLGDFLNVSNGLEPTCTKVSSLPTKAFWASGLTFDFSKGSIVGCAWRGGTKGCQQGIQKALLDETVSCQAQVLGSSYRAKAALPAHRTGRVARESILPSWAQHK